MKRWERSSHGRLREGTRERENRERQRGERRWCLLRTAQTRETAATEHPVENHPPALARAHSLRPDCAFSFCNRLCMLSAIASAHCALPVDPFRAPIGSRSHGFLAFLSNPNYFLKDRHKVIQCKRQVSGRLQLISCYEYCV